MNTLKQAKESGSISLGNSKMPGTTFAVSAKRCNVGSGLAKVKGSVCEKCYALRIQRFRKNVDKAWELNYQKWITSDYDTWVASMTYQIKKHKQDYHRWFDSGDLESNKMLDAIIQVCYNSPEVKHWLSGIGVSLRSISSASLVGNQCLTSGVL